MEAEGERQSKILKATETTVTDPACTGRVTGSAVLALGSRSLDKRAITVLSFDALKTMANGQATKIIFPFEISSLIKQGAKYLGATESMDDKEVYDVPLDESLLGDIPTV